MGRARALDDTDVEPRLAVEGAQRHVAPQCQGKLVADRAEAEAAFRRLARRQASAVPRSITLTACASVGSQMGADKKDVNPIRITEVIMTRL